MSRRVRGEFDPTCEHCRYYAVRGDFGECRRRAPQPGWNARLVKFSEYLSTLRRDDEVAWIRWPEVLPDDWCGEFERLDGA